MLPRLIKKLRDKIIYILILIIFGLCYLHVYKVYIQNQYKNVQWSEERCISELSSVKYQLNVITEYKNRIDKLLTEKQKAHEEDKERFKDIMESCVAMKQQSSLCQSQFEDLQVECKKVKDNLNQVTKELEKLKPHR